MRLLRSIFLILIFSSITPLLFAQTDSTGRKDTGVNRQGRLTSSSSPAVQQKRDSVQQGVADSVLQNTIAADTTPKPASLPQKEIIDTSSFQRYMVHPWLPMNQAPAYMMVDYRIRESKDYLFYLLYGIILLLAFIKVIFPKYFRNLFLLFFQTSLRQKQTREQLLQDTLASLLINLLFIISAGLFISLLMITKGWLRLPFWTLYAYVTGVLIVIYTGKYLFLVFAGWVFNNKEVANGYIFLVSMINRILGILLIPFSVFMAFGDERIISVVATLSIGLVVLLLLYRYLVSFGSLRNDLKINAFHFFLYLCAVEILPMLVIYKLLVNYIG
jgi:hypothetical protein